MAIEASGRIRAFSAGQQSVVMTTIEPLEAGDFEQVARWLSRPEINKWLSGEWRDHEATPSILAITVRNRRNKLYLVRYDSAACGLVGLAEIDPADRLA